MSDLKERAIRAYREQERDREEAATAKEQRALDYFKTIFPDIELQDGDKPFELLGYYFKLGSNKASKWIDEEFWLIYPRARHSQSIDYRDEIYELEDLGAFLVAQEKHESRMGK